MKLYNAFSKEIEELKPLEDKIIKMYVCGITPYDTTHIGHAFTYSIFDILNRYLSHKGNKVEYVQCITDVDAPMFKRAARDNEAWDKISGRYTEKFLGNLKDLNILLPDKLVKTSDEIDGIIGFIEILMVKGYAYQNQNVYFDSSKFADFGKLSGYSLEKMLFGFEKTGENTKDERKRNKTDFTLWNLTDENPSWKSPFGNGRPGWHIECSTIATRHLGEQIDIHGGGSDLVFPHHDCEIALSESVSGKKPFAGIWMHTGNVMYGKEKMSKSLGNLVFLEDVLDKYSANALRLYFASKHYRRSFEFELNEIREYQKTADLLELVMKKPSGSGKCLDITKTKLMYLWCLDNDLNTPNALHYLKEIARQILEAPKDADIKGAQLRFRIIGEMLGFNFTIIK